ncbi:MAG: hypothetical protein EZS28_019379, partial [Streblomastix strix]
MATIYLQLFRYQQIFKELQIKAILIKSDSSTAVQDLAKQRAGQSLVAEAKKIIKLCQQLKIQTQTQHIPGISIKITNARSRLSAQGYYSVERDIHILMPGMVENFNIGLVRNRGKQTHGQIRGDRRRRGRGRMVERIFQTVERGDLLDPPTNSEDWKSPDRLGEVQTQINHDSTLVARSNMAHALTNRQQQIPYSWRELSDSEPEEGDNQEEGQVITRKNRGIPHGPRFEQGRKQLTQFLNNANMTRETQQMIIEGQKSNIQKKFLYFDREDTIHTFRIHDLVDKNKKTKPSSAKFHVSLLNTMLLSYLDQYGSTWDINQLFEYWRVRPESNLLSDEELQVKLASLLMLLCFVRMEEMANIDLSVSIIDDEEHTAALCISPKQSGKRVRDIMQKQQKILEYVQQRPFLFGQQDLENTSNRVQQTSYTYFGLRNGCKLIRNTLIHVLKDLFRHLENRMQLKTLLDTHLLQNQQHRL